MSRRFLAAAFLTTSFSRGQDVCHEVTIEDAPFSSTTITLSLQVGEIQDRSWYAGEGYDLFWENGGCSIVSFTGCEDVLPNAMMSYTRLTAQQCEGKPMYRSGNKYVYFDIDKWVIGSGCGTPYPQVKSGSSIADEPFEVSSGWQRVTGYPNYTPYDLTITCEQLGGS